MFRKLLCAAIALTVAVGLAIADEFTASITKVDGNKITVQKFKKGEQGKKGEKDGDPITLEAAKDVKVVKGKFNMETKKLEAGDAVEGGLKAEALTKASEEKGVFARITTDDDNKKVTQIMVFGGKKKKKDAN